MPDPKISMRLPASHIPAPAATTAAPPRRARRESGGAVTNCSALEAILLHSLGMSNALKRLADGALNRVAGTNLGSFRPADQSSNRTRTRCPNRLRAEFRIHAHGVGDQWRLARSSGPSVT